MKRTRSNKTNSYEKRYYYCLVHHHGNVMQAASLKHTETHVTVHAGEKRPWKRC